MNTEPLDCSIDGTSMDVKEYGINYVGDIVNEFIENPEIFNNNDLYLTEINININIKLDTYNMDVLTQEQINIKSKIVSLMKKIEFMNISHCEVNMDSNGFSNPSLIYSSENTFDYDDFENDNTMETIECNDKKTNESCKNIDYICNNLENLIESQLMLNPDDRAVNFKNFVIDNNGELSKEAKEIKLNKCTDCSCFDLANNENGDVDIETGDTIDQINRLLPWEIYNYLTYDLDDTEKLNFVENDCMNYYLDNLSINNKDFVSKVFGDNYEWDSNYDYTRNLKESIDFENDLKENKKTSLISLKQFKNNSEIFNLLKEKDFNSCK